MIDPVVVTEQVPQHHRQHAEDQGLPQERSDILGAEVEGQSEEDHLKWDRPHRPVDVGAHQEFMRHEQGEEGRDRDAKVQRVLPGLVGPRAEEQKQRAACRHQ